MAAGSPAPAHEPALAAAPDASAIPVLSDALAPGNPAHAAVAPAAGGAAEADVVVEAVPTPHVPAVELQPSAVVAEEVAVMAAPVAHDVPPALTPEDAQHVAERLRDRLTTYLTGEGREAIEARCRDALHDHTAWLVSQITREVALALETEVMEWVRDAIDVEIARRSAG
ncbi:DUF2486 family protein [Burkholderia sp. lig30]|uniref:DUF2486 family protein n=1 Tax=Burkholderia sp. lig30 TaxID=1192124 RepID=UPI003FA4B4AE